MGYATVARIAETTNSGSGPIATLRPVTDFHYRPEEGVVIRWALRVSGYDDEIDGQLDIDRGRAQ